MAMYLFTGVEAMRNGVRDATEAGAGDSMLVVYRENRYCPFTSRLPQWYTDRIERLEGVKAAVPMQVLVSNCRASLDVVTFRGVPEDDLATSLSPGTEIITGSISDWTQRGDAAIVGEALAARRGVRVGDQFQCRRHHRHTSPAFSPARRCRIETRRGSICPFCRRRCDAEAPADS